MVTNRELLRARRPVRAVNETPEIGGVQQSWAFGHLKRRNNDRHTNQATDKNKKETTGTLENTILEAQVASRWD